MSLESQVQQLIGDSFGDPQLLETAFYHTSYVNEHAKLKIQSNERLEFLGDAVLELIVSQFLFRKYPDFPEGKLTRMRAQLVCEESLALLARQAHFDQYIKLGHGERVSGGQQRDSILSDCFEAFLGAFYLDHGIEEVTAFLEDYMLSRHEQLLNQVNKDFKTLFQEEAQKNGAVQIEYRVIDSSGPAHRQIFTSVLLLNGQEIAQGQGRSKKAAEMQAAERGHQKLLSKNKKSK